MTSGTPKRSQSVTRARSSRLAPKLVSSPPRGATPKTSRLTRRPTKSDDPPSSFLKSQSSREIAEVIGLLRAAQHMRVIELSPAQSASLTEPEFRALVREECPLILRGYASEWVCTKRWAEENYLKQAAAEEAVACPHRKYRQFTAHSAEQGRLHLTDGKSKAKPVSMASFLDHTDAESADGLYMLGIHSVHNGGLSYCPVQVHADDQGVVPPLARDVPKNIEVLNWYGKILMEQRGADPKDTPDKPKDQADVSAGRLEEKRTGSGTVAYDHQQFFLARGYAFTDLHYDSYDNFYVAVTGVRRWTMACPGASRWLIDAAGGKLKSGSSCVPHQEIFAPGSPAQVYPFGYVDLAPGDLLFVPACWWHLVESRAGADGFSSAFNFFFSKPPDEVFGAFQARLAETDAMVGALQAEVRARNAKNIDEKETILPTGITAPPADIAPSLWADVVRVGAAHGMVAQVLGVHKKLSTKSIEKWHTDEAEKAAEPEDGHATKVETGPIEPPSTPTSRKLVSRSSKTEPVASSEPTPSTPTSRKLRTRTSKNAGTNGG